MLRENIVFHTFIIFRNINKIIVFYRLTRKTCSVAHKSYRDIFCFNVVNSHSHSYFKINRIILYPTLNFRTQCIRLNIFFKVHKRKYITRKPCGYKTVFCGSFLQFLAYIAKKSVTFDKTESVIDKFEFLDIKTNNNIFSVRFIFKSAPDTVIICIPVVKSGKFINTLYFS